MTAVPSLGFKLGSEAVGSWGVKQLAVGQRSCGQLAVAVAVTVGGGVGWVCGVVVVVVVRVVVMVVEVMVVRGAVAA